MKKIFLTVILAFSFAFLSKAQNGVVILTEETLVGAPYTTTVHVTLANGSVTSTVIPDEQTSVANHDAALNTIINSITASGYKLLQGPSMAYAYATTAPIRNIQRLFFAQP
jgi:hypothetical protein